MYVDDWLLNITVHLLLLLSADDDDDVIN